MQHIRGVNGPILGHYRFSTSVALSAGLAANASIFSARWATTLNLRAAITRLRIGALTTTAFTTAQEVSLAAFLASGFTASDTGGTAITPPAGQNSLLQVAESGQASQFTNIQIASGGALAAGTRTTDSLPILLSTEFSTSPVTAPADFDANSDQRLPIILQGGGPTSHGSSTNVPGNAQGIVVNNQILLGAAGVVRYLIEMEWLEFVWDSAEVLG